VEDVGQGVPVVLLHSHGLAGSQWRRLAGDIVARDLRALAVDLTGQGKSAPVLEPQPFSFATDVERVAEIVRAVQPAHVVGHSYGGLVALHVARAVPGALRSLTVYDPVAFSVLDPVADRDARAILDDLALAWRATPDDNERWLRGFVEFWSGAGAWDALRDDMRAEFRRVAWVIREGVRTLMADRTPPDAFAHLDVPALLMTGERSPLPARRVVERLGQVMPYATVETIPGVGHLGPVTHARDVNPHVLATLTARRLEQPSLAVR
jgi:pimeloyl-ACP methyl ester carboxylesterase